MGVVPEGSGAPELSGLILAGMLHSPLRVTNPAQSACRCSFRSMAGAHLRIAWRQSSPASPSLQDPMAALAPSQRPIAAASRQADGH